ncbi:MAG: hypothetical protein ACI4QC_02825 [Thermoguttaceae bacterium]
MTRIIYTAAFVGGPPCYAALNARSCQKRLRAFRMKPKENAQPFVRPPL